MKLNVEVRKVAEYEWSVYVNGELTVTRESFAVADRVAGALRGDPGITGESAEVARSIRDFFETRP